MKFRLAWTYIVALHLWIAVMLWKTDFAPRILAKFGMQLHSERAELSSHFYRMLRYHKASCSNIPQGATLFIGDSLTQGLCVASVTPLSVNYGIGSDTTVGVLTRLDDYKPAISNSSRIVLAIGINDLALRSNDDIIENFNAILNKLSGIPVFVSSLLPVDPTTDGKFDGYPKRIAYINAHLQRLCENFPNASLIESSGHLDLNADGHLDKDFHNGDGIHLNPAGNRVWAAVIRHRIEGK